MTPLVLPKPLAKATQSLFAAHPLDSAMGRLVVAAGDGVPAAKQVKEVETLLADPALAGRPALAAGLWLYVDALDLSHRISQQHEDDPTFCFWHAIMHRREGDFSNSGYWFRRAGNHPAIAAIKPAGGKDSYNPLVFVRQVEAAQVKPEPPPQLVALQRLEWSALFSWCAGQP